MRDNSTHLNPQLISSAHNASVIWPVTSNPKITTQSCFILSSCSSLWILWPTQYKGGGRENLLPMRMIVRLLQSLMGGRGGSCKVYHDTAKIYVIRSEFSPMALELFTSRRQKENHHVGRYKTFLVPAQVSVQRRTESHKKQSNITQQNGTVMETN